MAENDPNNSGVNSGGTASSFGAGGTGTGMSSGGGMTTGSGATGSGFGVGSGSDLDGGTNPGNYGTTSSGSMGGGASTGSSGHTDTENCPHCGQAMAGGSGMESILNSIKSQFQNVDIDEYLNNARDMLKGSSTKATSYAKENPGKVAAGVAALALGAGLIYAAVNRDRNVEIEVVDGEAERIDRTGMDRTDRSGIDNNRS